MDVLLCDAVVWRLMWRWWLPGLLVAAALVGSLLYLGHVAPPHGLGVLLELWH